MIKSQKDDQNDSSLDEDSIQSSMKHINTDNPICYRFPFMKLCGCTIPCKKSVKKVYLNKICEGI